MASHTVAGPRPVAHDLVVIGASAGGVETLREVVAGLPADLPAAVCIVLHVAPNTASALAEILSRAGRMPCTAASNGDTLRPGTILVAPPDHHLLVHDGQVVLDVGPRENGHRPAIDALFRSAARARQASVVGVVLSGTRDDGTAGLAVIKSQRGAAIVQDPEEAPYSGMPASAIAHVAVDAIAPTALIAATIAALVHGDALPRGVRGSTPVAGRPEGDVGLTLVCPECGGALQEHRVHGVMHWDCHVGHRYSSRSLAADQGAAVEAALWTALRSLEDRAALMRRLAEQASHRDQLHSARLFSTQAEQASDQADLVRGVVRDSAAAAQRQYTEEEQATAGGEVA